MAYVFTPIVIDTFHRADENPLDPVNWTQLLGPIEIVSDMAVAAGASGDFDLEAYTGVATPDDQYVKITIGVVGAGASDNFGSWMRVANGNTTFMNFIFQNNGDGTGLFSIIDESETELAQATINVPNPGDIFTFGAVGTTFFAELNGVQFLSLVDTLGHTTGVTSLGISYTTTNTDTSISRFEMGGVSNAPTSPSLGNVRMATGQTSIIGPTHNAHIGSIKFGPRICVQGAGSGISGPSFIMQEDGISTILVESGSGSIIPE